MDSKYIVTSSGAFYNTDELYHHGIKGMKWGIRRYQNPDGSLTERGRKRYANPDGSLNEKGKKKFGNSVKTAENAGTKSSSGESTDAVKQDQISNMSDSELQARVNRLRNEDAYRDLSKKLGYDTPNTELAAKIVEMEQQKKYLELQRDIDKLTPKRVSKGKQIVDTLVNKVIEPAVTAAGKKVLEEYLTKEGMKVIEKTAKKETEKVKKTVDDASERIKDKQTKEENKRQVKADVKAEKQSAKEQAKADARSKREERTKYTVEGEGTSRSSIKNDKQKGPVIDVEDYTETYSNTPVTSMTTTSRSNGYKYIERIKTDYGYRYIYELPAGS